jgi:hypothetical protein
MAYGRRRIKGHCIFSIFCGFTDNIVHYNAAFAPKKTLLLYLSEQYGFQVSSMVCAIEGKIIILYFRVDCKFIYLSNNFPSVLLHNLCTLIMLLTYCAMLEKNMYL